VFSIVDYLVHQILGNVESQIEIEKIFLKQAYYKPKGDVLYNPKNLQNFFL
jgi:hypothetical protein